MHHPEAESENTDAALMGAKALIRYSSQGYNRGKPHSSHSWTSEAYYYQKRRIDACSFLGDLHADAGADARRAGFDRRPVSSIGSRPTNCSTPLVSFDQGRLLWFGLLPSIYLLDAITLIE